MRAYVPEMLVAIMLLSADASASDAMEAARRQAADMAETVSISKAVHYATGINPDAYPCAKAGIITLYKNRQKVADLSALHPRRIFAWMVDATIYYMAKIVEFVKSLLNPAAVENGMRNLQAMARGGNPLTGIDRRIESWISGLGPHAQFALREKMEAIIRNTTDATGACKTRN